MRTDKSGLRITKGENLRGRLICNCLLAGLFVRRIRGNWGNLVVMEFIKVEEYNVGKVKEEKRIIMHYEVNYW